MLILNTKLIDLRLPSHQTLTHVCPRFDALPIVQTSDFQLCDLKHPQLQELLQHQTLAQECSKTTGKRLANVITSHAHDSKGCCMKPLQSWSHAMHGKSQNRFDHQMLLWRAGWLTEEGWSQIVSSIDALFKQLMS